MATSGLAMSSVLDKSRCNTNDLEIIVKECLNWSRERWESEGKQKERLKKLVNSLRYWRKMLVKAQSKVNVIITLYNEEKNVYVSLQEVIDSIWELDDKIDIRGFATFRNKRYISVSFKDEKVREFVFNNLKFVGDSRVAFLDWAGESAQYTVKTHWLASETSMQHSKAFVEKYFVIKEQKREKEMLMNGVYVEAATVCFKGALKENVNVDDVPHLTFIDGLESLVTVSGRKLMCLTCNIVGHKAKFCPTPYCGRCNSLQPRSHKCVEKRKESATYADKVKNSYGKQNEFSKEETDSDVIFSKHKKELYTNYDESAKLDFKDVSLVFLTDKKARDEGGGGVASSCKFENADDIGSKNSLTNGEDKPAELLTSEDRSSATLTSKANNIEMAEEGGSNSPSEESDAIEEEDSETHGAMLKVESYLKELQKLAEDQSGNVENRSLEIKDGKKLNVSTDDLESKGITLKRKQERSPFGEYESTLSWVNTPKTYGGSKVKKRSSKTHKNINSNKNF